MRENGHQVARIEVAVTRDISENETRQQITPFELFELGPTKLVGHSTRKAAQQRLNGENGSQRQ